MNINPQSIYDRTRSIFLDWYPQLETSQNGACLYVMQCTLRSCYEHGVRALPMAGSAHWRMNNKPVPEPNTFSYVWSPHEPQSIRAVAMGGLPEMHCWVLLENLMILDCCAGRVHRHALALGSPWEFPALPDFIYGPAVTPQYRYDYNKEARAFAIGALRRGIDGKTDVPKLSALASQ